MAQARRVTQYSIAVQPFGIDLKIEPLGLGLRPPKIFNLGRQLFQACGMRFNLKLACFNLGIVQHVIDHRQHQAPGFIEHADIDGLGITKRGSRQ